MLKLLEHLVLNLFCGGMCCPCVCLFVCTIVCLCIQIAHSIQYLFGLWYSEGVPELHDTDCQYATGILLVPFFYGLKFYRRWIILSGEDKTPAIL